jgi:hypothetical protein
MSRMRSIPVLLLLSACNPYVQSSVDRGYAECAKYFECQDESEIEDYLDQSNLDSELECRERVDLSARLAYQFEEQLACYEEFCNYDAGNQADCIAEIQDQDCDDLADEGWSEDKTDKCSQEEVWDCPDDGGDLEDLNDCLEDAAENK